MGRLKQCADCKLLSNAVYCFQGSCNLTCMLKLLNYAVRIEVITIAAKNKTIPDF